MDFFKRNFVQMTIIALCVGFLIFVVAKVVSGNPSSTETVSKSAISIMLGYLAVRDIQLNELERFVFKNIKEKENDGI